MNGIMKKRKEIEKKLTNKRNNEKTERNRKILRKEMIGQSQQEVENNKK